MTSSNDDPSFPEPLPGHLKALLELTREAHASAWGREHWRAYWRVYLVTVLYGFVAWHSHDATATLLFFFMLVIAFMLAGVQEQRERHRLELLLEVIRNLQRPRETSERT